MTIEELLENYQAELSIDIKINKIDLSDFNLKIPTIKHKWVTKYIGHKTKLNKLKNSKKDLVKKLVELKIDNSPIKINKSIAEKSVYNEPELVEIDNEIAEQELIIDYLDRVQDILKNIQWDVKNMIEIEKLETQ